MLHNYELSKQNYADLLSKEQQSQLATSLEKRQEGEQFRLVDPPSLPTVPSRPERLRISLGALAAGMALGLALVFLLEMTNHTLNSEKDVNRYFSLPLVIGIPLLPTPSELRLRRWRTLFECLGGFVLVITVLAAEFYVYRQG
jgi:hypothetical protein